MTNPEENLEQKLDDSKKGASISRGGAPSMRMGETTPNQQNASMRKKVLRQFGGYLTPGDNVVLNGESREYAGRLEIDSRYKQIQLDVYGVSSPIGKTRELPASVYVLGKEYKTAFKTIPKIKVVVGQNSKMYHRSDLY